jgi:hypothetical protein
MAKNPAQRYQTGREILRDLARLRGGVAGSTMAVSQPSLSVELAAVPRSSHSLPAAPSARSRRIVLYSLIGASVAAALVVGAVAGWMRRSGAAQPDIVPMAKAVIADEGLLPVNDEEALRKLTDTYLQPTNAGRDVSVGMELCLKLGVLYLEQHRLDDAEKLFDRLAKVADVPSYRTLGRLGDAIVLALRDKAEESNKAFREVTANDPFLVEVGKRAKENKPADPEFRKMWTDASFRFWLAKAINSNVRNGILPNAAPPPVLRWRQPPEPKS